VTDLPQELYAAWRSNGTTEANLRNVNRPITCAIDVNPPSPAGHPPAGKGIAAFDCSVLTPALELSAEVR
jgi:hypothetical protein